MPNGEVFLAWVLEAVVRAWWRRFFGMGAAKKAGFVARLFCGRENKEWCYFTFSVVEEAGEAGGGFAAADVFSELGPEEFVAGVGEVGGLFREDAGGGAFGGFVFGEVVVDGADFGVVHGDEGVAAFVAVDAPEWHGWVGFGEDDVPKVVAVGVVGFLSAMFADDDRPAGVGEGLDGEFVVGFRVELCWVAMVAVLVFEEVGCFVGVVAIVVSELADEFLDHDT